MIYLLIAIYLVCSTITAGAWVAYFQNKYILVAEDSYEEDVKYAIFLSFLFPVASWIIIPFNTEFYKYGISFKKVKSRY